jgi:type IV secretory pathway protease TraF
MTARAKNVCNLHTARIMRISSSAFKVVVLGLAPIIGLALLRSAVAAPAILYNPSPSEPRGFYLLPREKPAPGRLAAFRVPAAGRAYVAEHIRYLVRDPVLKEIVVAAGSTVCSHDRQLTINGRREGGIARYDHFGIALPHWSGCIKLRQGEYFALSHRIPNSFDSRYYGPVRTADIVGIYVPLWTE